MTDMLEKTKKQMELAGNNSEIPSRTEATFSTAERSSLNTRGVTLLPITRVLVSITRLANTRDGYE